MPRKRRGKGSEPELSDDGHIEVLDAVEGDATQREVGLAPECTLGQHRR